MSIKFCQSQSPVPHSRKTFSSIYSLLLYTSLGQAFPRAALTKSQQEKEDEQENVECLRGVVCVVDGKPCARSPRARRWPK